MGDRSFSDGVQYRAVLANLKANNGRLRCALCGRALASRAECHFDHILAYAKGGRSTADNCQILCAECNLSKSDKEMQEFLWEEKARRFMNGEVIEEEDLPSSPATALESGMTKERFDEAVGAFIRRRGGIRRVDFTREKNGLPPVTYIAKYYGSMNELKQAIGLEGDPAWNRERIWARLLEYTKNDPGLTQSGLTRKNGLPSLPCILAHFPEYKSFSDIRIGLGLELNYESWTEQKVLAACREYLKDHEKITLKDLKRENGLPTSKVVYRCFGTMRRLQEAIGTEISISRKFISGEELLAKAEAVTDLYGSTFETRADFLEVFPHSLSVISYRFGTFDAFAAAAGITLRRVKKAKYTKQEVDDGILAFLKDGNPIPTAAEHLSSLGLPSASTILRFYDDWKEPFVLYSKMISITKK